MIRRLLAFALTLALAVAAQAMSVKAGSTDVTTYFVLRLAATGVEATGLTITNLDLVYTRSGADHVAKQDATALAAADSAHTDNKAIEVDATSAPGLYRVDWPDAAFAAGAREVILTVICATAFTEHLRVELTPVAADAVQWLGQTIAAVDTNGYPKVTIKDGTGAGEIDTNAGHIEVVHLVDLTTLTTLSTTTTTVTNAPTGMALESTLTAMKGATFDTATDSLEAIRNRGDGAWLTGSTHSAADVKTAIEAGGSSIAGIKAQTDLLTFTGSFLQADLRGMIGYTLTQGAGDRMGTNFSAWWNVAAIGHTAGTVVSTLDAADVLAAISADGNKLGQPGVDSAGVTTLLTRLPAALTFGGNNVPLVDVRYQNGSAVGNQPPNFSLLSISGTGLVTYANAAPPAMILAIDIVTAMQAAGTVLAKLNSGLVADGGVYQWTANALELGPTGGTGLAAQQIRDAQLLAPTPGTPMAVGSIDAKLNSAQVIGAGATEVWLTINDSAFKPVPAAAVWITTDAAGANQVAGTLFTNDVGRVRFFLDNGVTYYRWAKRAGYTAVNPQSFTVQE